MGKGLFKFFFILFIIATTLLCLRITAVAQINEEDIVNEALE